MFFAKGLAKILLPGPDDVTTSGCEGVTGEGGAGEGGGGGEGDRGSSSVDCGVWKRKLRVIYINI